MPTLTEIDEEIKLRGLEIDSEIERRKATDLFANVAGPPVSLAPQQVQDELVAREQPAALFPDIAGQVDFQQQPGPTDPAGVPGEVQASQIAGRPVSTPEVVSPRVDPMILREVQKAMAKPAPNKKTQDFRIPIRVSSKGPGLWDQTKKAWERSGQSIGVDFLYHKVAMGEIEESEAIRAEREFDVRSKKDPIEGRNWAQNLFLQTVQVARPMAEGATEGAAAGTAAAGTATVAGQLGPQVVFPEEIVTVPGAFAAGNVAGSLNFWSQQGSGAIYRQARKQGVSPEAARFAAAAGGPLYAFIEYSQVDKIIPGLGRLKGSLLQKAIKVGVNTAKNIGEEGVQRLITDGAVNIARAVEGQIHASDVPAETKQMALNALDEMKQAAGPLAVLGVPGMAVGVAETIAGQREAPPTEGEPTFTARQPRIPEGEIPQGPEFSPVLAPEVAERVALRERRGPRPISELPIQQPGKTLDEAEKAPGTPVETPEVPAPPTVAEPGVPQTGVQEQEPMAGEADAKAAEAPSAEFKALSKMTKEDAVVHILERDARTLRGQGKDVIAQNFERAAKAFTDPALKAEVRRGMRVEIERAEAEHKQAIEQVKDLAQPTPEADRLAAEDARVEAKRKREAEQVEQINVFKTTDGKKTGITEQQVSLQDGVQVETSTGKPVVLDTEASGGARVEPTPETGAEEAFLGLDLTTLEDRTQATIQATARGKEIADFIGLEEDIFVQVGEGKEVRGISQPGGGIVNIFVPEGATQDDVDKMLIHELGHQLFPKPETDVRFDLRGRHENEKKIDAFTKEKFAEWKARPVAQPTPEVTKPKPTRRIVSDEKMAAAKKRLIDRGTIRTGIDPQGLVDIVTVGVGHFERGLTKFKDWSKQMVADFGNKVKPHLKSIWNDVKSGLDPEVVKLRQAIKGAKLLTPQVQEKQRRERRRRVGRLAGQIKSARGKPGSPEQQVRRATGALKGPLTEYKGIYESIRTPENTDIIDTAAATIRDSEVLSPLTLISTSAAFTKLVDGDALTLGEASLLEQHFGRAWSDLLQTRVPKGDLYWKLFQEAINIPRTLLASGDVSGLGRQARPLGQIHPQLFAQMAVKYHKAFWSQESAESLEAETKRLPYYQEAVDDGVLELPEWGLFTSEVIERAERFAGAGLAENIPLGVGQVVRASERSFVTGLNWFRVAVYSQLRTQQDVGGIKTTKHTRDRIASRINDLSGRSHIKRTAAAKALQPLLNTLFSARFTISRFKPVVTLPTDAVRSLRDGKLSTELKMGAGALMSLAATNFLIMHLVSLAGDDDEVETDFDLRATDGGKLKLGPTRIDLWSGHLQPAQLMARLATGERKSAAGNVFKVSRGKILEDFGRSKLNPQSGLIVDAYTGETFIGERILQPPDPKKGPGRILTGIGVPSWVQGVGRGLLWNRMMFLTVQDTADAYIDSGATMGAVAGMLAWTGTGVTTYLPRASTELTIERNKMAQNKHGEKWEELSESQQKTLSKTPKLQELDKAKRVERNRQQLDLSFVTKEVNRAQQRIRRELPTQIQAKLDELGIRISAPSRQLGKLRLSDKRYEFYQAGIIAELKKQLPGAFKTRTPERRVKFIVDSIKARVRADLRRRIDRNEL